MPSRRWPGSRSRARPTDRAVDPAPLASISQPARAPRPIARRRRRRRATALRRGRRLRRGRGAARARRCAGVGTAFELLERAPERAAVLLAMAASLVASAPFSPSATLVTNWYRNAGTAPYRSAHDHFEQGPLRPLRRHRRRRTDRHLDARTSPTCGSGASFMPDFLSDLKVNAGHRGRSPSTLLLLTAAAIVLMVVEARKHGVRYVWAYIIGGMLDRDQRDLSAVPHRPGACGSGRTVSRPRPSATA